MRIALESLIIKQTLNCTDRETVEQVTENPYIIYFIGLKEFQDKASFGASSMVEFRKRFTDGILAEINEMIIENEAKEEEESEGKDDDNQNVGTLIVDALCAPADVVYPQDLNLLSEAREKLKKIIDDLHSP